MSDGLMNIRRWKLSLWWTLDYRIGKKLLLQKKKTPLKLRNMFGLLEWSYSRHTELEEEVDGRCSTVFT